jgi:hypothetical protein
MVEIRRYLVPFNPCRAQKLVSGKSGTTISAGDVRTQAKAVHPARAPGGANELCTYVLLLTYKSRRSGGESSRMVIDTAGTR